MKKITLLALLLFVTLLIKAQSSNDTFGVRNHDSVVVSEDSVILANFNSAYKNSLLNGAAVFNSLKYKSMVEPALNKKYTSTVDVFGNRIWMQEKESISGLSNNDLQKLGTSMVMLVSFALIMQHFKF